MRQALPGVCCLLAAGLLIPAVFLNGQAALASSIQVDRPVIACVDPRAVLALSEKGVTERHGSRWRANLVRRGRCFSILPGERWEQISSASGMLLMRRIPPQPGVPPLYFRAASLSGAPNDAAGGMETPVLEAPGQSVRTRVQSEGDTAPANQAGSSPASATAPLSPSPFPSPTAGATKADSGPDVLAPDISTASERGYAIGFAIAIMLIVVLLTGFALLLRELLRRPRDPANPWGPEADPIREPKLRPAPQVVPKPFSAPPFPVKPALARRPTSDPASLLQTAGPPREAEWLPGNEAGVQPRCTAILREAGWTARVRYESDRSYTDVVASRGGRIMALRCLPDNMPVDEQAVEEVCLARERERADVAVILSSADFTRAARQLAAQAGIDLLHEDELRAFVA